MPAFGTVSYARGPQFCLPPWLFYDKTALRGTQNRLPKTTTASSQKYARLGTCHIPPQNTWLATPSFLSPPIHSSPCSRRGLQAVSDNFGHGNPPIGWNEKAGSVIKSPKRVTLCTFPPPPTPVLPQRIVKAGFLAAILTRQSRPQDRQRGRVLAVPAGNSPHNSQFTNSTPRTPTAGCRRCPA